MSLSHEENIIRCIRVGVIFAGFRSLARYAASKLAVQNIRDCQYVAAMNPTAGSFQVRITIDDTLTFSKCMSRRAAIPWDFTYIWSGKNVCQALVDS